MSSQGKSPKSLINGVGMNGHEMDAINAHYGTEDESAATVATRSSPRIQKIQRQQQQEQQRNVTTQAEGSTRSEGAAASAAAVETNDANNNDNSTDTNNKNKNNKVVLVDDNNNNSTRCLSSAQLLFLEFISYHFDEIMACPNRQEFLENPNDNLTTFPKARHVMIYNRWIEEEVGGSFASVKDPSVPLPMSDSVIEIIRRFLNIAKTRKRREVLNNNNNNNNNDKSKKKRRSSNNNNNHNNTLGDWKRKGPQETTTTTTPQKQISTSISTPNSSSRRKKRNTSEPKNDHNGSSVSSSNDVDGGSMILIIDDNNNNNNNSNTGGGRSAGTPSRRQFWKFIQQHYDEFRILPTKKRFEAIYNRWIEAGGAFISPSSSSSSSDATTTDSSNNNNNNNNLPLEDCKATIKSALCVVTMRVRRGKELSSSSVLGGGTTTPRRNNVHKRDSSATKKNSQTPRSYKKRRLNSPTPGNNYTSPNGNGTNNSSPHPSAGSTTIVQSPIAATRSPLRAQNHQPATTTTTITSPSLHDSDDKIIYVDKSNGFHNNYTVPPNRRRFLDFIQEYHDDFFVACKTTKHRYEVIYKRWIEAGGSFASAREQNLPFERCMPYIDGAARVVVVRHRRRLEKYNEENPTLETTSISKHDQSMTRTTPSSHGKQMIQEHDDSETGRKARKANGLEEDSKENQQIHDLDGHGHETNATEAGKAPDSGEKREETQIIRDTHVQGKKITVTKAGAAPRKVKQKEPRAPATKKGKARKSNEVPTTPATKEDVARESEEESTTDNQQFLDAHEHDYDLETPAEEAGMPFDSDYPQNDNGECYSDVRRRPFALASLVGEFKKALRR